MSAISQLMVNHKDSIADDLQYLQLVCAALVACQASIVGLRTNGTESKTGTSVLASSLELVAALNVAVAIYMEHMHAIRSSAPMALFLFFTCAFDSVKSRSFILRGGLGSLGSLTATAAGLRLCLMVLEELPKRSLLLDKSAHEASGPESISGYWCRAFFVFLGPMFMTGFRQNIQREDMIKLGLDFSSKSLHERLAEYWNTEKGTQSKYRLLWACLKTWKWQLLEMLVPRLVFMGLSFSQPFLIGEVIETAEQDEKGHLDETSTGKRAGMQIATALIFVGLTLSKVAAAHMANRLVTQVRGGLIAQLMGKMHHISEQEAKKSAVLTHMSSDIEAIAKGLVDCIDIPMTLLETGFGVSVLSRMIGASCFFVLLPVMVTSLSSYLLGKKTGPALARWNKSVEIRLTRTKEVLGQLPGIKMLGLAPLLRENIHRHRVQEMQVSKHFRFLMALVNLTTQIADLGTPVIVIAAAFFWRGFDGKMSSSVVFPTLAVVGLIQTPTVQAVMAYSDLTGMIACFGRIQTFLLAPDRHDPRSNISASEGSESVQEDQPGSIQLKPMRPSKHSPKAVGFENASFGPESMDRPVLSSVTLSLERGSITGVIGSTGSGKSTFFRGLLGETQKDAGCIRIGSTSIAYCGPEVWLRDASIRDNVIGYLPFDSERYDAAVKSCQLEEDLEQFHERDSYIIGPNGSNLSGGQRQRVALARAAFANYDMTIIDDGFSALDRKTAVSILHALCGQDGMLNEPGSTVVLSTYLAESLEIVDQVASLGSGGQVTLETMPAMTSQRRKEIKQELISAESRSSEAGKDKKNATVPRPWSTLQQPANTVADDERRQGNWRLYLIFIDSIGRWKFAGLGALAALLALSGTSPEIYIRGWADRDPNNGAWFIGYWFMVSFACAIVALSYWLLYTVYAVRAAVNLHERILNTTMSATLGFLTSAKTGDLLNRFSQDANLFAKTLPFYLFRTMYMLSSSLILTGIILSSSSYMVIALPVIVAAIYAVQRFYLRTSRQIRHIDLEEKAPLYTYFCETGDGVVYLHAFGWEDENLKAGYRLLDNSQQPFYLMLCIQQWLSLVLGLLTALIAFTMVTVVVWSKNSTSGSAVGLSFLSVLNFQKTIVWLIEAWAGSETSVAALGRLQQYQEETPQEKQPETIAELPEDWPSSGAVNIEDVSASYGYIPSVKADIFVH